MRSRGALQTIAVIIIVAAGVLVGMASLSRPRLVPASAPADAFSAERAMNHVSAIAREPHPPGSPEIAWVRDYIYGELEAMGLSLGMAVALPDGSSGDESEGEADQGE